MKFSILALKLYLRGFPLLYFCNKIKNFVKLSPSSRSLFNSYKPPMIPKNISIKVEKMQTPTTNTTIVISRSSLLLGLKSPKPTVEREVNA
jgi:gamma-glutamylcysteine synthetase